MKHINRSPIITRDGYRIPGRSEGYRSKDRDHGKRRYDVLNRFSLIYIRPFYDRNEVYLPSHSRYNHTSTRYVVHIYYPADYPSYASQYRTLEGTLTTLASNEVVFVVGQGSEKLIYALEMTDEHLNWVYNSGELPIRVVVVGYGSGARNGYPVFRIKSLGLMP